MQWEAAAPPDPGRSQADALVLSSCGGAALWEKTLAEYMRRCPRPYMATITAVAKGDMESLVRHTSHHTCMARSVGRRHGLAG